MASYTRIDPPPIGEMTVSVAQDGTGGLVLALRDVSSGGLLARVPVATDGPTSIAVPIVADPWQERANRVALEVSLDLIQQTGLAAKRMNVRLSQVFRNYTIMLLATFTVGIGGFLAALYNAFWRSDAGGSVATTATFAGLSAATFVAGFISNPTSSMERLGPNTAWLLAIVNSYWTKLAYFNDPKRAVRDLERADAQLASAMATYLAAVRPAVTEPTEPAAQEDSTAPAEEPGAASVTSLGKGA